jgi:hypothetical protein
LVEARRDPELLVQPRHVIDGDRGGKEVLARGSGAVDHGLVHVPKVQTGTAPAHLTVGGRIAVEEDDAETEPADVTAAARRDVGEEVFRNRRQRVGARPGPPTLGAAAHDRPLSDRGLGC